MRFPILVALLSLLPITSIFLTSDLPHTHDGLVHLPRIAAYFKALSDGQIPVRFAGDLNYGYGLPLFNFIYHTPYWVASLFLFLGFGLVSAFKMTLALSFVLSGIFMFLFARAFFNDDKKALLVAIFYQFAPFRFVELLVRGSFGEVYTYTFLPLALFGLVTLFKKPKFRSLLLPALASALLILSHNSVSLLFFAILFAFVFFFAKTRKQLMFGLLALTLGLFLASFYWLPAILEHKYTYADLFMKELYTEHFAPLKNFFIPNITNSSVFKTGGIAVQIGLFHLIAAILSLWLLSVRRKIDTVTKKVIIGSIVLVAISLFFTQPISSLFWQNVSLLRQFQFPWRFLSVIVFASAMLSVVFLSQKIFPKRWAYVALLALVVSSTIFYWRPSLGYDKVDENYYWNFPLNTTYYGETDLIWSAGPKGSYPKERVDVIGGKARVSDFKKKSNLHTFTVTAETDAQLVDHTQYYPGWRAYVGGKTTDIEFQDPNWRGEITFLVPKGRHDVKVVFEESAARLLADILSGATLVALLVLPLLPLRKKL